MTTRNELEKMVMEFKVSDLQVLLGFAGQNRIGRKQELQKRALNLIYHKMSIPLGMKIRSIYRDMIAESQRQNSDYYYTSYDKYDNYYLSNGYSSQSSHSIPYDSFSSRGVFGGSNSYYDNLRKNSHFSSDYSSSQNFQEPPQPPKFDFMSYLEANSKVPDSQKLNSIHFKKLSFFNYKSDIVSVVPLIPQNKRTDVFEFTHTFSLNLETHSMLSWSKKGTEKESRYQLQLRMCLLNDCGSNASSEVEDALPLALVVKVNDKNCQLPPAIPSTNKQGLLLKRMNAPINITPQTSKKNLLNTLVVSWSMECAQLYGIAIHLVEKYTSDELISRLKQKGERDPEVTKKYVREKLTDDDDIAATSLKVSLICPLGKILMSLPARASTCNHLQCFDAALYIKMNEVKSVWQCPVCNQTCYYEDLFIDGFFAEALKSGSYSSSVTEIQINSDGSSKPILPKKRKSPDSEAIPFKKSKPIPETASVSAVNCESVVISDHHSPCKIETGLRTEPVSGTYSANLRNDENLQQSSASFSRGAVSVIVNNSGPSSTSVSVNSSEDQVKNNVVLVDLTSDTESEEDECIPLNLKKHIENKPEFSIYEVNLNSAQTPPPIYDIDDSDDFPSF